MHINAAQSLRAENFPNACARSGQMGCNSMKNPVLRWHNEHMQFERLLGYLNQQVEAFQLGEEPDYELMGDIVFYLKEYADMQHHQREDVAFRILSERDRSYIPLIKQLQHEHRVIDEAGDVFQEYLTNILNDVVVRRELLEMAAATYLLYYRAHIKAEEAQILPAAERLLTDDDWKQVGNAVPSVPDPLFGAEDGLNYRAMRAHMRKDAATAA
jgi:hemerythrin-like domain-containing protein